MSNLSGQEISLSELDGPENARTTAIGLFHFAHSYYVGAETLRRNKPASNHPDAVVRFLRAHATELYLKSFLRASGFDVEKLRKLGHRMEKLVRKAIKHGLILDQHQIAIVEAMADAIEDRYIVTGSRRISLDETEELVCVDLHEKIGPSVYKHSGISWEIGAARLPIKSSMQKQG